MEMVFNAGTHTDAIRMHYGDFEELSLPVVGSFARPVGAAGAVATKTRPQPMMRKNQGA
jgi:hypothetical protein